MPKQKRSKKQQLRHRSIRLALRHYSTLVLFLVVGVLMSQILPSTGLVLSYATNMSVDGLLQATNQERTSNGVAALTINPKLTQAAQAKANDMAARDYWSHNTPDGATPWTFVTGAGYSYQAISENLAYGFNDGTSVVTGWMNSAGHRTNMLNGTYTEVGFAFANSESYQENGNQTIVVAFYGKSMAQSAGTTTPSRPASQTPQTKNAKTSQPSTAQPSTTTTPSTTKKTEEPPVTIEQEDTLILKPTEENATDGDVTPVVVSSTSVSWLQTEVGAAASWLVGLGLVAVLSGITLFMYRHSLAWRQVIIHGEQFVMRHKYVDIATILLVVSIVVVIQTVGVIR